MKKNLVFVSIGFEFIAIVILAYFIGQFLDKKFQGAGVYTACTIVFGFFIWIFHIVILLKKTNSPD